MSAGVIPVQVVVTGLVGSPRSKTAAPLTPAAPWWMCISVAPETSWLQNSSNVAAPWLRSP